MERGLGQLRVEGIPFIQHQFFPGGGVTPRDRGASAVDRSESTWPTRETGTNWNSGGLSNDGERTIHRSEWNESSWRWDGAALSAQRVSGAAEGSGSDSSRNLANGENGRRRRGADLGLQLDSRASGTSEADHQVIHIDDDETEFRSQTFFGRHTPSPPSNEPNPYSRGDESPEDDGGLVLKLGGSSYAFLEENGAGKRGRSPSPQSQVPTCQVDGCTADLSQAKDYHRRHKVCEAHSKASTALVSRLMQRFCQQCSRFHPLDKFDDDKRSCRRRLEGHNKRRRKAQPDAAAARVEDQASTKNTDIMALLGVLSQLKGPLERASAAASEQDILLQCLRQAGNLPNNGLEGLTRAAPSWNQLARNSDLPLPQIDPRLLASQLTGHAAVSLPPQDAITMLLQNNLKQAAMLAQENIYNRAGLNGIMNGVPLPYPLSNAEAPVSHAGPHINNERTSSAPGLPVPPSSRVPGNIDPAQLLANVALSFQQSMAAQTIGLGNHLAGNGYAMAQPTVQRVLPDHSSVDTRNVVNQMLDRNQEKDEAVPSQAGRQRPASQNGLSHSNKRSFLDLQQSQASVPRPSIDLQQPPSEQYSDASETGSGSASGSASGSGHQSPGTPNREWENSRISFKLFDKHPGQFPEGLRSQIDEWLSHRPSDMEGFIRPGCIILTVFLSMPKSTWTELISDLPGSLKRLLSIGCEFWCTGRILVQVERQSVFIADGKIVACGTSNPFESPYLLSVRPLAVVAGQQNRLIVKGFNLTKAATRLLCAFRGKYFSEEVYQQYHTDDESVASVCETEETEDTANSLVQNDLPNLVVGESSSIGEEYASQRLSSVSAISPASEVDKPSAPGLDPSEQEDSAEGTEDTVDIGQCSQTDVSTSLFSTRAVFNLDSSIVPSTMPAGNFGRCFIEVDQDMLQGNWKPIIVADELVSAEICTLEAEIETAALIAGRVAEQHGFNPAVVLYCTELARLAEEEDVACFLNELGWFFQRSYFRYLNFSSPASQASSTRFKQLLLYSVERNWCAVVRKVLDIAFENDDWEAAFMELSDMSQEAASLLHRAVRNKNRTMVELLLDFSPSFLSGIDDPDLESFKRKLEFKLRWSLIFKPDMRGPAGLTPLHVAASMQDAEEVVDALTSGPCQAGLHAWLRNQDDSGATPLDLALLGRNMKSVLLVRAKLARLENPESTAIDVAPGWDHPLKGDSVVQLELPVWRTPREDLGAAARLPESVDCREADFARLPRSVCGVKGAIYRPFLVSIMGIACICVCVCLLLRGPQNVIEGFFWSRLDRGKE